MVGFEQICKFKPQMLLVIDDIEQEYSSFFRERRLPIEILRKRELKWLDMFQNWEKWMSKRFKKVRNNASNKRERLVW